MSARVVSVCDGPRDLTVHSANCRPLLCHAASECPPTHETGSESCIEGVCVDPARELAPDDAVVLCLAGTGFGHREPRQIERYALALNCGTPCKLPSPCRLH